MIYAQRAANIPHLFYMAKPKRYRFDDDAGNPLMLPRSYKPTPFTKEERERIVAEKLRAATPTPFGRKPKAIITMGAPCSGKSTIIKRILKREPNFVHIDPDEIRMKNKDYQSLINGDYYRRMNSNAGRETRYAYRNALENKHVLNLTRPITRQGRGSLLSKCIAGRYNLIYDSVCQPLEKCQRTVIERLRASHDIIILLVYSPLERALKRAAKRAHLNGRYMDPHYVERTWRALWTTPSGSPKEVAAHLKKKLRGVKIVAI